MPNIDFDQKPRGGALLISESDTRSSTHAKASIRRIGWLYSGLSLRASITVKASGAPPRCDGIWLPAWRVSSFSNAQDLLIRLGHARSVEVPANFAEHIAALGIERGNVPPHVNFR